MEAKAIIEDGTLICMDNWVNETAIVTDLVGYGFNHVANDSNRLYSSLNTNISSIGAKPIHLNDGDIVQLKSNGRFYYIRDCLHIHNVTFKSDIVRFTLIG